MPPRFLSYIAAQTVSRGSACVAAGCCFPDFQLHQCTGGAVVNRTQKATTCTHLGLHACDVQHRQGVVQLLGIRVHQLVLPARPGAAIQVQAVDVDTLRWALLEVLKLLQDNSTCRTAVSQTAVEVSTTLPVAAVTLTATPTTTVAPAAATCCVGGLRPLRKCCAARIAVCLPLEGV